MINVKRISHATFETPDLDRQIDYFTEIAGLALAERENGRAFLATKLGDLAVELEKGDQARCARLAFQVAPNTEFDDIRRDVEAEGLRCQTRNDPSPGIPRMLAFEDPKGTVCELGFRVSDWIQDWFVFMRCGPDHHTVNFVQGKRTQMHHIAFELKDWAQIQLACDFLGGKNIPIIWGPGRHGPGHNVYTYHRNPDDQIVEMFTELDKMLDESLGYFEPRPWHRDRPQAPKVWTYPTDIWGPPPTKEYIRQRE
jgi:catechol 2,3-dioxygenase-like lactoylglutathione lyase family enzyme